MVSEHDLEATLATVPASAGGPVEGIFGPASMTWRIDREAVLFLGAGRALLLQLAHPWVAAAIADHSRTLLDPIGRFHRTFELMFTLVFGSRAGAFAAARRLHRRHAMISGVLPEAIGPFAAGSTYCANDAAALRWVHATLVETSAMAYGLVLPPLSLEERERYWEENRMFGALFGLQPSELPADWSAFADYNAAMAASDILTVSPTAREIAGQIFAGVRRWLRPPRWYIALSVDMLPERLRAGFAFDIDERDRRAADCALKWIRHAYPYLPSRIRYAGPYQEAQARLQGRKQPDLATRCLNRAWIGRPRLADVWDR